MNLIYWTTNSFHCCTIGTYSPWLQDIWKCLPTKICWCLQHSLQSWDWPNVKSCQVSFHFFMVIWWLQHMYLWHNTPVKEISNLTEAFSAQINSTYKTWLTIITYHINYRLWLKFSSLITVLLYHDQQMSVFVSSLSIVCLHSSGPSVLFSALVPMWTLRGQEVILGLSCEHEALKPSNWVSLLPWINQLTQCFLSTHGVLLPTDKTDCLRKKYKQFWAIIIPVVMFSFNVTCCHF